MIWKSLFRNKKDALIERLLNGHYSWSELCGELLAQVDALVKERDELDAIKAILADPAAVHVNIMLGRIALPDYYVRTTDTHGEWAQLKAERDEALEEVDTLRYEAIVLGDGIQHHKGAAERYAKYIDRLVVQRSEARWWAQKLLAERDEARAICTELYGTPFVYKPERH